MDAEGSDVGTSLAADPEDTEVTVIVKLDELALVDGSDTELALDGRDQRGTLEERTGEGLEGTGELGLAAGQLVVQADDGDVLLSGTLLRLDQTSGAVNADNQTSCNLGVEGSAVAGLLASGGKKKKLAKSGHGQRQRLKQTRTRLRRDKATERIDVPKNALDPGDDLVGGRVGGLVEVDDAGADVRLEVALQRRASVGNGSKVSGSNQDCGRQVSLSGFKSLFWEQMPLTLFVVLEEQRPLARVNGRCHGLRLDGVLVLRPLLHKFLGHLGQVRLGVFTLSSD